MLGILVPPTFYFYVRAFVLFRMEILMKLFQDFLTKQARTAPRLAASLVLGALGLLVLEHSKSLN